MKICDTCKNEKSLIYFAKDKSSKDGLQKKCKICKSEYNKKHYKSNKKKYLENTRKRRAKLNNKINEFKNKPCTDCGIWYHPTVMDFDHTNNDKINKISTMVRGTSWDSIINEIKKCELVCANCHRLRTYNRIKLTQ